jgi:flagellar hook protein FlgE
MMRTFNSSVLGLQSFQTQMDVISNNIANVNNNGYKKTRVLFEDVLNQTMSNGQAPTTNYGGTNSMQIGLGSRIGAIDNVFTQGAMQGTGRDIDMAIQGDGFFVTTDGTGAKYFTRSGAFDLDSQLNFVHGISATKGMGWLAAEDAASKNLTIDTTKPVTAINFANFQKIPAASTTFVEFASNLQLSATDRSLPAERTLTFTDDQGDTQTMTVKFSKVDKNNWLWTAFDTKSNQVGTGSLKFDDNGRILESKGGPIIYDPDGTTGTTASISLQAGNSANITDAVIKTPVAPATNVIKSGVHSLSVNKVAASAHSITSDKTGISRFNTLAELGVANAADFKIAIDGSAAPITLSGLSTTSTVSELISAINTQAGGVTAEMQGDRLVVKRALNGPTYSVTLSGNTATPIFGAGSTIAPGVNQSFTVTDYFTASNGTSNTIEYKNVTGDITIGKSADNTINNGEIVISSASLQPGNATITTKAAHNAGSVTVNAPQTGAYSAAFQLATGGTELSGISTQLITGATHNVSMNVYDSAGYNHKVNMEFEKAETNKWVYTATLDASDPLVQDYFKSHPIAGSQPSTRELKEASASIMAASNSGVLVFDKAGKIDAAKTSEANGTVSPKLAKAISFTPAAANTVSFEPDFDLVTQYDSTFSTAVKDFNGYEMGKINGLLVEESGIIKGSYSNGQKIAIAQVALASFVNNGGLVKKADNLYAEGGNSGDAQIGATGSGGRGTLLSQNLEMSNVDLAAEFTDMIISQRGFQANAKTINTADQMLQEIIGLKR